MLEDSLKADPVGLVWYCHPSAKSWVWCMWSVGIVLLNEWVTEWSLQASCPVLAWLPPQWATSSMLSLLEILGKSKGDKTHTGADSHSAAELETTSYHCIIALVPFPTPQRMQPKRDWVIPHKGFTGGGKKNVVLIHYFFFCHFKHNNAHFHQKLNDSAYSI